MATVERKSERSFFQCHEISGCRAKVTVEWSWPENEPPPQAWIERAELIAEDVFTVAGPRSRDIARALRGEAEKA